MVFTGPSGSWDMRIESPVVSGRGRAAAASTVDVGSFKDFLIVVLGGVGESGGVGWSDSSSWGLMTVVIVLGTVAIGEETRMLFFTRP